MSSTRSVNSYRTRLSNLTSEMFEDVKSYAMDLHQSDLYVRFLFPFSIESYQQDDPLRAAGVYYDGEELRIVLYKNGVSTPWNESIVDYADALVMLGMLEVFESGNYELNSLTDID